MLLVAKFFVNVGVRYFIVGFDSFLFFVRTTQTHKSSNICLETKLMKGKKKKKAQLNQVGIGFSFLSKHLAPYVATVVGTLKHAPSSIQQGWLAGCA